MHFKLSSAKLQSFCPYLNIIICWCIMQSQLTCGLVMLYAGIELCKHWLRYCLVAWWHQAITWSNVDLSKMLCGIHLRAISWVHMIHCTHIMGAMTSQITSLTSVYSTVCSGANQRKHQSSVSLAFARVIHRWPVNSPHKWPVTRKMFPFDDVIML